MVTRAANNGSIYVWDLESHNLARELTNHSDAVRCIGTMGEHNVASGSASREGKVFIWNLSS